MYVFKVIYLVLTIFKISTSITVPWDTQPSNCLQENAICVNNFISIIKVFNNIHSAEFCSRICHNTPTCQYFNFFPPSANPLLAEQCHLLDSCHTRRLRRAGPDGKVHDGPAGPVLGQKDCSRTDCQLQHARGGQWFWFDKKEARNSNYVATVSDDTRVLYFCADKPLETAHCEAGQLLPKDKLFKCPCKAIEESDDVECDTAAVDGEVEGGTKCTKKCGDKVVEVSYCDLGDWTADLSEVECFAHLATEEGDKHGHSWTWLILSVVGGVTLLGGLAYILILRRVWAS